MSHRQILHTGGTTLYLNIYSFFKRFMGQVDLKVSNLKKSIRILPITS